MSSGIIEGAEQKQSEKVRVLFLTLGTKLLQVRWTVIRICSGAQPCYASLLQERTEDVPGRLSRAALVVNYADAPSVTTLTNRPGT